MTPSLRIGVWSAVSSRAQAKPDRVSLDDQEQAGRRFAELAGGQVVAVYRVPGHSRDYVFWHEAETEMPAYRAVREDLEAGRLDLVHCVSSDRLGRDPALVQQFYSLASRCGAEVYDASMPHPLGQQHLGHRIGVSVRSVLAGEENELRAVRHRMGMKGRIRRGLLASQAPLGYVAVRDDGGRLVGYELTDDAETVRQMTRWFLDGHNYNEIRRRLEAGGFRSSDGAASWAHSTVRDMLRNDTYAGLPRWGQVQAEEPSARYPALWDGATFAAVVRERQRRSRGGYHRSGAGPLTGVAWCVRCRGPLLRFESHGRRCLRCGTHSHRSLTGRACHPNILHESAAVAYLAGWFRDTVSLDDLEAEVSGRVGEGTAGRLQEDADRARRAAASLDDQRMRLAGAFALGRMDVDIYARMDRGLADRLDGERARATDLEAQLSALPDVEARVRAVRELAGDFVRLVAEAEPATVSRRLQEAGLRLWCEVGVCVRVTVE